MLMMLRFRTLRLLVHCKQQQQRRLHDKERGRLPSSISNLQPTFSSFSHF